jgi:Icc protein
MIDDTGLQRGAESRTASVEASGEIVNLVQISDAHLCETPGGTLLGMDTDHSLQMVIQRIASERGRPDILLLTGDLSDYGSAAAYSRMHAYSKQLTKDCFWLPGNHDDREVMAAALAGSNSLSDTIRIANWQIIMLDSQVPGRAGGGLGEEQLSLLAGSLEQATRDGLNVLVCLHHHPIEIGCAWLDEQIVADADAFFAILDRHSAVKGVLWGHIHQQVDSERNGVLLMGSPSTCVQFAPGSEIFKADDLSPGYRWLDLYPNGVIDTGVSRVEGVKFTVDLDSQGYL